MNNEKQYKIIKKFYRNKRVLITGATGFKGAWLSFWLNKLGSNVCTIGNNPNKNKSLFYGLKLQKKTKLPNDALLGLLAHASLAVGLVILGFLSSIRFDIMGLLFGDILAVNQIDLMFIWIGGALILIILKIIWKPLFASTVNYELAEAEGMKPDRANAIFTILMAAIIAISIKIVGLLLITGMLIIPAAMARNISSNPQQMVFLSVVGGLLSVVIGLFSSLEFNTPSGPSIITAALILFCFSLIKFKKYSELKK